MSKEITETESDSLFADPLFASSLAEALAERHRQARRHLEGNDIVHVLERMEEDVRSIQGPGRERLRRAINGMIGRSNLLAIALGLPTGTRIKGAQKIAGLLDALSEALSEQELNYALALEQDELEGREGELGASMAQWQTAFPAEEDELWVTMMKDILPLPSQAAFATVRQAHDGIDLLALLAKMHIAALRRHQKEMRTKASPRGPDYSRYGLILGLVSVYEKFFGVTPTVVRESTWIRFLAAVLSRCEGEPLYNDGAYDIWRKARKWGKGNPGLWGSAAWARSCWRQAELLVEPHRD